MQEHIFTGDLPGQPAASLPSIGVLFHDMSTAAHSAAAQPLSRPVTLPLDAIDDSEDGENAVAPEEDNGDMTWPYAGLPLVRSPFCLLVDPQPAQLAARHMATLPLPKRAVYLFNRKETGSAADDPDVVDQSENDDEDSCD